MLTISYDAAIAAAKRELLATKPETLAMGTSTTATDSDVLALMLASAVRHPQAPMRQSKSGQAARRARASR